MRSAVKHSLQQKAEIAPLRERDLRPSQRFRFHVLDARSAEEPSIWIKPRFQKASKLASIAQPPVKKRASTQMGNKATTIRESPSAVTSGVL
jgi:hypothetical protein